MQQEYMTLLAGFIGALLGAAVSFTTTWLQARAQERRDQARMSLDAAIKDFESAEVHAQFLARQGNPTITRDLGYYILLHSALMEHASSRGLINEKQWVEAHERASRMSAAVVKHYQQQAQQTVAADRREDAAPAER